jgi:phospholipid/cholesterol/gamma-HCH transport system substrate-binding protein
MRWAPIAAMIVIVAALTVIVLRSGSSPYVVRAEFPNADGLQADFSVRVQGVVAGRVARIAVTPRDTAIATLELDRTVAPIGNDAGATINPSNLLGEKYVALNRGDIARPARSGALIPLARTSVAPEVDQVLGAFDPSTRQATAIFLSEEGNALLGRGADLAATLRGLPRSLTSTERLVSGLGHDNVALGKLVDESDRILASASPQRAALGRLVGSAQGAFTTLASRERALGDTISAAPGAIAQLGHTLVALEDAAGPLGPAAAGLRATAPPLAQALREVPRFAAAAAPALETVRKAAPALRRLGERATPVVRALGPTAARLDAFTRSLAPVSQILGDGIGNLLGELQGWARAISDRDGVGHIYRTEALLPSNILTSVLKMLASPTAGARAPARRHVNRAGRPQTGAGGRNGGAAPVTRAPSGPLSTSLPHLPSTIKLPGLPPITLPAPPGGGQSSGGSGADPHLGSLLRYLLGR